MVTLLWPAILMIVNASVPASPKRVSIVWRRECRTGSEEKRWPRLPSTLGRATSPWRWSSGLGTDKRLGFMASTGYRPLVSIVALFVNLNLDWLAHGPGLHPCSCWHRHRLRGFGSRSRSCTGDALRRYGSRGGETHRRHGHVVDRGDHRRRRSCIARRFDRS